MTNDRRGPPRIVVRCLEWLLPGLIGVEALSDLESDFERMEIRRGRLFASIWYAGHIVRPSTWSLAFALRFGSKAAREVGLGVSWLDVKLGVRMMVKHPGTTLVSGIAMSVTAAIAVGIFSLMQDRLFEPELPLPEGDRIVSVGLFSTDRQRPSRQLLHEFEVWRERLRGVRQLSIWRTESLNVVGEDGIGRPTYFTMMSASGFEVAQVPPILGRPILVTDEIEGAPPVMVIGHREWQGRFGGDPDIVGRRVQVGRDSYTVVGVMPPDFGFPFAAERWIPFRDDPDDYVIMETPHTYYVFGRLASRVTIEAAQTEIERLANQRAIELPRSHEDLRAAVVPYTETFTGRTDPVQRFRLWVLISVLSMLVLIPFTNVAILLYARTASRTGELSIRNALGASRRRVVTQLFVEALVLSSLAVAVGAGFALFILSHIEAVLGIEAASMAFWVDIGWDLKVAVYVGLLALLAAGVVGVIPGLKATRRGLHLRLNREASGNGMRLGGGWTALIVTQVALTVALLPVVASLGWQIFGAGLVRPAFDAEQLVGGHIGAVTVDRMELLVAPDPTGRRASELERARLSIEEVLRELESESSVSGLALSSFMPGRLFELTHRVEVEGVEPPDGRAGHLVSDHNSVSDNFFDIVGVVPTAGRTFRPEDVEAATLPVVVNRRFVETILQNANPIGRRIRHYRGEADEPAPWVEIVGVVDDLVLNPTHPEVVEPRIFRPFNREEVARGAFLVVRVRGEPQSFVPELRRVVTAIDPTLRLGRVARVGDLNEIQDSLVVAGAIGFAIVVASVLLLSAAGIFSMMSLNVTQRRREIGLRSALGANHRRVLATVMARSVKQLVIGTVVGLGVVLSIPPVNIDGVLIGRDLVPVLFVSLVVACVGMVAVVGAARRGLRIHPTEALRDG